ncbi:hypothetical protein Tco_1238014 [Tanacetum coccineum]
MLGSELQGEDFAKKMVDLVNQRKKYFAEERAKAKRNKPMTQTQLKTYMMNYLKNQGTWKLSPAEELSMSEKDCNKVEKMTLKIQEEVSEQKSPVTGATTTNGYQFTMSNRHKDWLVQEKTALGKDFSNPFYG